MIQFGPAVRRSSNFARRNLAPFRNEQAQQVFRVVLYGKKPALLALLGFLQWREFERSHDLPRTAIQTYALRDRVHGVVDLHQDLIRAQRGYVLTSDVTFLDEYEAALGRVNRVTAQLANDLRGQEGFEQTADRLAGLGQAKLGQIQAALRLHQAEQTSAAVDLIDSRESQRLTAEIRNEILRIDQVAEERLQRALVAAERASLSTRNLALATQLILLLAILASGLSVNRLIDNQRRAGQRYRDLSVRQDAI